MTKSYHKAMDRVFGIYNNAGFSIAIVISDPEFQPVLDPIKNVLQFMMNYASANEHVPQIEHNNCTLKERVHSVFHALPYSAIPRIMIKYLVFKCTKRLNWFAPKGGVSAYYSPHVIMKQHWLKYDRVCKFAFGDYVQSAEDNANKRNQAPRMLDCIYLHANW